MHIYIYIYTYVYIYIYTKHNVHGPERTRWGDTWLESYTRSCQAYSFTHRLVVAGTA